MKTAWERNSPDKRVLWFVLKEHRDRIATNAGNAADACHTGHTEVFDFRGPNIGIMICGFYDTGLDTAQTSLVPEERPSAQRAPVRTTVEIELVDSPEEIGPASCPEQDIIVVDKGAYCEMIRNKFGECKKFSWGHCGTGTEQRLCFSDFIAPAQKQAPDF